MRVVVHEVNFASGITRHPASIILPFQHATPALQSPDAQSPDGNAAARGPRSFGRTDPRRGHARCGARARTGRTVLPGVPGGDVGGPGRPRRGARGGDLLPRAPGVLPLPGAGLQGLDERVAPTEVPGVPLDLILAQGAEAVRFVQENRAGWPDVPVVFFGVSGSLRDHPLHRWHDGGHVDTRRRRERATRAAPPPGPSAPWPSSPVHPRSSAAGRESLARDRQDRRRRRPRAVWTSHVRSDV